MPLVAGEIIDSARDERAEFNPARHPDKGALRFLSRAVRVLQGKVAALDPSVLEQVDEIDLPLDDFDAGIPLAENSTVVGVTVVPTNPASGPFDVTLVPYELRNDYKTPKAAGFVRGGVLYLAGDANRWQGGKTVQVRYIATPEELENLQDDVPLPDAAEDALVALVAAYFARRAALPEAADFERRAVNAEASYLRDVTNRFAGQTFFVRDVMGGR